MVMSGMAITAQRSQSFSFVGPYMLSGKSILTKSSVLGAVDSAKALNDADLRLAALENSTSQDFIEKVMPNSKLVKVKDYDAAVQMLLDDKIDALVADMPICMLTILRNPDAGLTTLKEPFTFEPIGIAVPANDMPLRAMALFSGGRLGRGALEALVALLNGVWARWSSCARSGWRTAPGSRRCPDRPERPLDAYGAGSGDGSGPSCLCKNRMLQNIKISLYWLGTGRDRPATETGGRIDGHTGQRTRRTQGGGRTDPAAAAVDLCGYRAHRQRDRAYRRSEPAAGVPPPETALQRRPAHPLSGAELGLLQGAP